MSLFFYSDLQVNVWSSSHLMEDNLLYSKSINLTVNLIQTPHRNIQNHFSLWPSQTDTNCSWVGLTKGTKLKPVLFFLNIRISLPALLQLF
jgi:hypothetical protein